MAIKVINSFKETNHKDHIYKVGDTYPAEGFSADEERVSFLSKKHPSYRIAFLEVEGKQEEDKKSSSKKNLSTKK
jgi:hypothetical protein